MVNKIIQKFKLFCFCWEVGKQGGGGTKKKKKEKYFAILRIHFEITQLKNR